MSVISAAITQSPAIGWGGEDKGQECRKMDVKINSGGHGGGGGGGGRD